MGKKSLSLFLLVLCGVMNLSMNTGHTSKLIYVGDPMCSWCYGFAPELLEVKNSLAIGVEFEVLTGGLRPYGTETMGELKSFLTHHWEEVNKRTGQKFSYGILDSSELLYDTEPSCRAVVTMRMLAPEKEFEYFKLIQKGFYIDNFNPASTDTYARQAEALGVDRKEFKRMFESEELKLKTRADFQRSRKLGVNSFPSIVLLHNGEHHLIGQGYAKASTLLKRIERITK